MTLSEYLTEGLLSKKTGLYKKLENELNGRMGFEKFSRTLNKYAVNSGTVLRSEFDDLNAGHINTKFILKFVRETIEDGRLHYSYGHDGEFWHFFVCNKNGTLSEVVFDLMDRIDEISFWEYDGKQMQGIVKCTGSNIEFGIEMVEELINEDMQ